MIHKEAEIKNLTGKPILIDYTFTPDNTKKPVIVFTHGFKGFKDWGHFNVIANYFASHGFVYIKYNGSHNGTTPSHPTDFVDTEAFGNNNFSIELDDLGLVIDWVSEGKTGIPENEVDPNSIYLIGHSRGGGITILKAAEDDRVKKIVTWAAVNEFGKYWSDEIMKKWKEEGVQYIKNARTGQQLPLYYQLYDDYFSHLDRLYIPGAVKKIKIPFLTVHGTEDEAVPVQAAHQLKGWNQGVELFILEGGKHTFGGKHPWVEDTLPEQSRLVADKSIEFLSDNIM
jgi:uncharacterized protein